jgi:D-arabinono-1,4-lactone oxidase
MVNLDSFSAVLGVNREKKTMKVQAGIRLRQLNDKASEYGLTIPNLGSINDQSIAGAIATGTHGSSLYHGTLGSYVLGLRIVLGNGSCVSCSASRNSDLFRAALVSLGALGIIVEVEYQMIEDRNIEWTQTILSLDSMLASWHDDLWTQAEFTRIWWLPYTRRVILWRATPTSKASRPPWGSWYDGALGYYVYKALLWLAHYIPSLLPRIEWFVFGMQYSFSTNLHRTAIEPQRQGLLMNCLYSQFVNEWAVPLSAGPSAISQLDQWIHRSPTTAIPPPPCKVSVHAPIEVRVSNTSSSTTPASAQPRPFLEPSHPGEPTLYLNATLYRPFGLDPPCHKPYYAAFEKLMRQHNGRPHWAKNFATVTSHDIEDMYGADLDSWRRVRREVDPDGLFVGDWVRRTVLGDPDGGEGVMSAEEKCVDMRDSRTGGVEWVGGMKDGGEEKGSVGSGSVESFDVFTRAEASDEGFANEEDGGMEVWR